MKLVPVSGKNADRYLDVGRQSYREHYLHLWHDADPSDYFNTYFTPESLGQELEQDGLSHYIVQLDSEPIGIIKLNDDQSLPPFPDASTLLLEKIYLLKEFSGKGYGKKAVMQIEEKARTMAKRWLWLETMQKGNAKFFYRHLGYEILKETRLPYPNAIDSERPMLLLIKDLKAS